ncbi:hypothetical protein CBQ28_15310 [Pseudoalteromonas sp. GCY]|uniref:hypothetical protein n=1 Tax=Pseudoalteromonas sp. GCY TaxID=2003316 RepID=UPI000BFF0FB6|nr:hypothetical protein [Pseudoalteromonas sp. GCY]PHI36228.1 hypothetical protein CBQ28_15310 [Pseudoalteromonas sp. GCY]QQQ64513.1 hypothetical protein JJQ94_02490 [Pseudoalteromonas sp. GCY]
MKVLSTGALLFAISTTAFAGNPTSVGDVVARDLSISGLGWAGHVGIWDGSKVLEVLNDNTVIHKNTLSSFKGASSYWGAKYGRGTRHGEIVEAGWAQRSFDPEYTITAQYTEGKWVYQNGSFVKVKAKFRCDTFVNYSYKKVTGENLVTVFTPRNLYNSFPSTR